MDVVKTSRMWGKALTMSLKDREQITRYQICPATHQRRNTKPLVLFCMDRGAKIFLDKIRHNLQQTSQLTLNWVARVSRAFFALLMMLKEYRYSHRHGFLTNWRAQRSYSYKTCKLLLDYSESPMELDFLQYRRGLSMAVRECYLLCKTRWPLALQTKEFATRTQKLVAFIQKIDLASFLLTMARRILILFSRCFRT